MKKFIIMGLTLFAFALVGCKTDKVGSTSDGGSDGGNGDTAQVYTITNTTAAAVEVSSGEASVSVENSKCVSVKADQWAALKVADVCDNSNTAAADADQAAKDEVAKDDCPAAGNYNIAAKTGENANGNELTAADAAGTDCAPLEKAAAADAGTADAGTADAGTADAGAADAGTTDAGTTDAGGNTDAGSSTTGGSTTGN
jgi:hypothetical protein